jgi:putative hemin transport protein
LTSLATAPADLRARWASLRDRKPGIRIRDAAAELGVSELELLVTDLGNGVTRLRLDFPTFLPRLAALGPVMALTRNESCVIETDGTYDGAAVLEHASQVVSPGVDLRIFPSYWVHLYAVEKDGKKPSRSLQIFEADGTASHKVFLREGSNLEAFRALVDELRHEEQDVDLALAPYPAAALDKPDGEVDREGLLAAWGALTDTHDFFRILRRFGVSRTQALRLAEGRFTRAVDPRSGRKAIEAVAERGIPIMAFVASRGTIQIFTGKVKRTLEHEGWFNIMDPGFNLHLDDRRVVKAWVVQKNGERGVATSLELFDADGSTIVMFFGVQKPGYDGGAAWKALTDELS